MTERAKWLPLGGLVLIWGTLLILRVLAAEEPSQVPLKFTSGAGAAKQTAAAASGVPTVVRPPDSPGEPNSFHTPKNIFAPLDVVPVLAKPVAPSPPKPGVQTAPPPVIAPVPPPPSPIEIAAQQEARQREAAIQQARQRMTQYRFLGYLTEAGAHRAFLAKGSDLYIVTLADTVEAQIQVTSIDQATVKLTDTPTHVETSLPLVKDSAHALSARPDGNP
jgi:hypothetical protein